jgi:hypothetical protein
MHVNSANGLQRASEAQEEFSSFLIFFPSIPQREEAWEFLFKEGTFQVMWIATCVLKATWPPTFSSGVDDFKSLKYVESHSEIFQDLNL